MTRAELIALAQRRRATFMGCPMDLLTLEETVDVVRSAIRGRLPVQHVVVNVAKLVYLQDDESLATDVRESDLINVDGMGVLWGARLCGLPVAERVAGIDLMGALLEAGAEEGWRPYFLGATPEVLGEALKRIGTAHPGLAIAGSHHGYFGPDDEADVAAAIGASGADILFVAISSPKKEAFMHRWRDVMDVPFIMGVGGAIDVMAGKVRRAPPWMQRTGLEWAYRVGQEPRRMWRRYAGTNLAFLGYLAREFLRARLGKPSATASPSGGA